MAPHSKNPPDGIPLEELLDDGALPPMPDDVVASPGAEELAGYLDPPREDGGRPGAGDDVDGSLDLIERELVSIEEGSWIDEAGGVEMSYVVGVDVDNEGGGWSVDGADDVLALEDGWFDDGPEAPPVGDSGEEGPVQDGSMEIDSSGWDDLEGWDEGDDETVEDLMERLGISMPKGEESRRIAPGKLAGEVESAWLGPKGARVAALSAGGGRIAAVGDGVFLLGGDDMLHRVEMAIDLEGTSVTAYRDLTFIGTERHGLLVMTGADPRLRPSNGWNTLGMTRPPKGQAVETPFRVDGQRFQGGFRLIGRDGSGQLFASSDFGATWSGPMSDGRCLAMTAVGGAEEVLAAMIIEGEPYLLRSTDLARWTEVPITEAMERVIAASPIGLSATGRTMVVASSGVEASMFVSLDGGRSWRDLETPAGVCAVAIDPQDPAWIAMAARLPHDAGYTVRVSRDGGILWKTASVCCDREENQAEDGATTDEPREETRDHGVQLVVKPGPHRALFLVTPDGVHRFVFSSRETSH